MSVRVSIYSILNAHKDISLMEVSEAHLVEEGSPRNLHKRASETFAGFH